MSKQEGNFCSKDNINNINKNFDIYFINTTSLRKRYIEITSDSCLTERDVLFLIETKLADADNITNIHHLLNYFSILFNNSNFRFSSLAIAYRCSVQIYNHEGSNGISILKFCKHSISEHVLCLALNYKKHSPTLSSLYKNFETLNSNTSLNFIIKDFNLDALMTKFMLVFVIY